MSSTPHGPRIHELARGPADWAGACLGLSKSLKYIIIYIWLARLFFYKGFTIKIPEVLEISWILM